MAAHDGTTRTVSGRRSRSSPTHRGSLRPQARTFRDLDRIDEWLASGLELGLEALGREGRRHRQLPHAAHLHALDALLDALAEHVLKRSLSINKGDGFFAGCIIQYLVGDGNLGPDAHDATHDPNLVTCRANEDVLVC